jgi:1,4-alpha-glucan branching enzyme
MSLRKRYLKDKNTCQVTFTMPKKAVVGAKKICLVGDFNKWEMHKNPMKKNANGSFSITLELEKGKEYQYRYLINDTTWENDWAADKYVTSPYGDCDNSVVIV